MPWSHARAWHKALWALYDLGENADRVILSQTAIIDQQSEEIKRLKVENYRLTGAIMREIYKRSEAEAWTKGKGVQS